MGVDPGLADTGYGFVKAGRGELVAGDFGTIRSPAGMDEACRLGLIYDAVTALMRTHTPDAMAVERVFFNTNTRSAMAVGQARGVVLLAAAKAGIPVHEYTPLEVKLALTSQGRAGKGQVAFMVKLLLGFEHPPSPDHAADALAVAICCAHRTSGNPWQVLTAGAGAGSGSGGRLVAGKTTRKRGERPL